MRLREPYVRKHICIWIVSDSRWQDNSRTAVERECRDCGVRQCATLNHNEWPQSLWALADVQWTTEKLSEFLDDD